MEEFANDMEDDTTNGEEGTHAHTWLKTRTGPVTTWSTTKMGSAMTGSRIRICPVMAAIEKVAHLCGSTDDKELEDTLVTIDRQYGNCVYKIMKGIVAGTTLPYVAPPAPLCPTAGTLPALRTRHW